MSAHGNRNLATGTQGEDAATRWYEARGYQILARNWRCPEGELDLVVARRGELVFCEVKTRGSTRYGTPADAVTPTKRRRLRRLATRYLATAAPPPTGARQLRFDVASVLAGEVTVIEAAF